MPVPRRATVLGGPGTPGCNRAVDEPDETPNAEVTPSLLDIVTPELDRCSALADGLAHLLLPARLFS